jgi:hypothetical protein
MLVAYVSEHLRVLELSARTNMTASSGWTPNRDALRGRVADVAGATRGAGRGIAAALGEAGATVVCTGRTTRSARSKIHRPETIEETAELVTHLGGHGVGVVDHLESGQVKELAERIRRDYGGIDALINDIWGGELLKGGPSQWNRPIWEHSLDDPSRRSSAARSSRASARHADPRRPACGCVPSPFGEHLERRRNLPNLVAAQNCQVRTDRPCD